MFICDSFCTFHASLKATFDRRGREELSPSLPLLSAVCNFQQEKEFTWYAMITLATVLDCHNKFTSKGNKCSTNRAKMYEHVTASSWFLFPSCLQDKSNLNTAIDHRCAPADGVLREATSRLAVCKMWADPENIWKYKRLGLDILWYSWNFRGIS